MRIVGRSLGALTREASIRDAEAWFLGSIRPPSVLSALVAECAAREATTILESISYDDDLQDLLPYVLDAHGPGSRASVMKDASTKQARDAKRASGVFYTPSDVASYIVRESVEELGIDLAQLHVLDPACGSGVFLRAALGFAAQQVPDLDLFAFVERHLFGIDINPLAVEAACFVLLHDCIKRGGQTRDAAPWSLWHRIRSNVCVADSLVFQVATPKEDRSAALCSLRASLGHAYQPPSPPEPDTERRAELFSEGHALGDVFPAIASGADVVIGNPPYATIGPREDHAALEQRFDSLLAGNVARSDYFPAFIEMMWLLARKDRSSAGMVVPLSLAYSGRAQMTATRRAIMEAGGRWRFAFFDREPHALFGEDVKTRNTIVFRGKSPETNKLWTIETGPLRKWTSRQRALLFESIDFTPLGKFSIASGIPKLSGVEAAEVFTRLTRQTRRLSEMCVAIGSCLPSEATSGSHPRRVFVAGTAYNFLNVFRAHRTLPVQRAPWSESPLHVLSFSTEGEASRAFAVLSSRIVYWLWHVTEDGFHVTRSFLLNLPFGNTLLNDAESEALGPLGDELWDDIQKQQISSVNGSRQTIAYRPHASEHLRDRIDAILLRSLGVEPIFVDYLRAYERSTVAVDDNDETRRRFTNHFVGRESRCHE
jgi:hypothetical protein